MNNLVTYWKLEKLANVWVQAHDVNVSVSLIVAYLVMETHGFSSTTIKSISGIYWTLLRYRMRKQFGFLLHYLFVIEYT
jgi:hypothetical protein